MLGGNRNSASSTLDLRDIATHFAFAVLAIMASILYAERIFADASYYLMHLINRSWFYIEHDRVVLAFSQILPWIGVLLGLSMKVVLILFSIGHVAFFYLLFLVCRYRYKDRLAGLLLVLLQTIALEMGYYTPMFELYYGTALLVLFSTMLWQPVPTRTDRVFLALLSVLILMSHPFAMLLWGFVIVFHAIEFGKKYLKWYGLLAGLLILFLAYKMMFSSAYEQTKTTAFIDTFKMMSYGGGYVSSLTQFMFRYYSEMLVLFLLAILGLLLSKKYLQLTLAIVSFFAMLVIINGAHYGFQHSRYHEQVYFPLAWIAAFPFVYCLRRDDLPVQWKKIGWTIAFILIAIKLVAIWKESKHFTNRIERIERQIHHVRKLRVQRAIVDEINQTASTSPGPNWSYPIESLLLSARQGADSVVTLCLDTDMSFENNSTKLTQEQFLFRKWDIFPLEKLNRRYFHLQPGGYVSLSNAAIAPMAIDSLKEGVTISVLEKDIHMPGGEWRSIGVEIQNRNAIQLPADTISSLYLSYHWSKGDSMILWDGHRTALELDVTSAYQQTMDIAAPEETGHYILTIDLVTEGVGWWNINTKKTVWVY